MYSINYRYIIYTDGNVYDVMNSMYSIHEKLD